MRQLFQETVKLGCKGGFHLHLATIGRMSEAELPGMQKEPFQSLAAHFLVKRRFTVLIVTGDWVTGMQGMHADLVGTAGDGAALDQGRFGKLTHDAEPGFRRACHRH